MTTLREINSIRPILATLLVLYHALSPWCGTWPMVEGCTDNEVLFWIGRLSYDLMLPTFIAVSGYVWAYQRISLSKTQRIEDLLKKKFIRLYIPSVIFSIAYIFLFVDDVSFSHIVNGILSGVGHLWFLPMLFWVFVFKFLPVKD